MMYSIRDPCIIIIMDKFYLQFAYRNKCILSSILVFKLCISEFSLGSIGRGLQLQKLSYGIPQCVNVTSFLNFDIHFKLYYNTNGTVAKLIVQASSNNVQTFQILGR